MAWFGSEDGFVSGDAGAASGGVLGAGAFCLPPSAASFFTSGTRNFSSHFGHLTIVPTRCSATTKTRPHRQRILSGMGGTIKCELLMVGAVRAQKNETRTTRRNLNNGVLFTSAANNLVCFAGENPSSGGRASVVEWFQSWG